jgi:eukaryotic-like serine/threonine-protein kinase
MIDRSFLRDLLNTGELMFLSGGSLWLTRSLPVYVFFILHSMALAQTSVVSTDNTLSSEGAMAGVNLGRTGVYQAKGVHQVKGLLWKSNKLFEINYAGALTMNFDGSSGTVADLGFSEPVLGNGKIYFQLCVSLKQNFIIALDAKSGRGVWNFESKEALSAPAVVGDTIFVVGNDGNIYALDAGGGKEKWRFSSKGQQWYVNSAPAVADGAIYFTSLTGNLYAVDIATRETRWVFTSKGILTTPAFDKDAVYIGNEKGFLYSVDVKTGKEKWNFKAKGGPEAPVVADGAIYFRTKEGNLYCLDSKTGQQKWMSQVGGKSQPVFPITSVRVGTSLAFYDNIIYFAGVEKGGDHLFAIDAQTGQQIWKSKVAGPCRSPIIAEGLVYLGSLGIFYAIDAKSGTEKWSLEAKSEFKGKKVFNVASSPAVDEALVYFVTDEGFFYAVN